MVGTTTLYVGFPTVMPCPVTSGQKHYGLEVSADRVS